MKMGEPAVARHYEPSARVRAQLAGSPPFGSPDFWGRVAQQDSGHPEFFDTEVLVKALRHFRSQGDLASARRICEAILKRWGWFIQRQARYWSPDFEEDQHDMRQEVCTQLWITLLDPSKQFWEVNFYHALRYLCYDKGKGLAKRRERELPLPVGSDEDGDPLDELPDITDPSWKATDEILIDEEEKVRIRQVLAELPAPIARVLFLRYVLEWQVKSNNPSVMTIAKALGVTERTVTNHLKQGRVLARQKYEEKQGDE